MKSITVRYTAISGFSLCRENRENEKIVTEFDFGKNVREFSFRLYYLLQKPTISWNNPEKLSYTSMYIVSGL